MTHFFKIMTVAGIVFIGPNSEALLSNASSYDMDYAGYHCTLGQQQSEINVIYQPHPVFITSCDVTYKKNSQPLKVLWKQQRGSDTCVANAASMALRLEDRGWQCQTDGL